MICDGCGLEKDDVFECYEPFAQDVHDTNILVNYCHECYQNSCDDI